MESLKSFGGVKAGSHVGEREILFARIDPKEMEKKIEAQKPKEEPKKEAKKDEAPVGIIGIDDFMKVSLSVAEIKACEKLAKSKKLLKLQVESCTGPRQIVSGIAPWYAPEALVGKKVIIVDNLKPAKLCGELSEGMILAGDNKDGNVKVLFADELDVGAKIH